MKIVGIEDSTFIVRNGADSGKQMEGYRIHLQGPLQHSGVGVSVENVWCRKAVGDAFFAMYPDIDSVIGVEVQPLYNRGARSPSALMPLTVPAAKK